MMRSTPDEIRRRIAKRKRNKASSVERQLTWSGEEDKYDFPLGSSYESGKDDSIHPLFKKELFIFKLFASAVLFLVVAILFRNHTATLDPARDFITRSMDKDFKFATVSKWYEDKFGKPLALLPVPEEKAGEKTVVQKEYAIPASGKILENFEKNGQGIMIETGRGASVEAINEGKVRFAGMKEGLGKTVIVQHPDDTESWYANLAEINVNLYEYIEKKKIVGTVSDSSGKDKAKGTFYFAIKKGDHFIDPIQVIRFD